MLRIHVETCLYPCIHTAGSYNSCEEVARDEQERRRWEVTFCVIKQLSGLVCDLGSQLSNQLNGELPTDVQHKFDALNQRIDDLTQLAPVPGHSSMQAGSSTELPRQQAAHPVQPMHNADASAEPGSIHGDSQQGESERQAPPPVPTLPGPASSEHQAPPPLPNVAVPLSGVNLGMGATALIPDPNSQPTPGPLLDAAEAESPVTPLSSLASGEHVSKYFGRDVCDSRCSSGEG